MLLRIQDDELLHSYISRSILLNFNDPSVKFLGRMSKSSLRSSEIKTIATVMGWQGCHGFNRILHCHTDYPIVALFKSPKDLAYSSGEYVVSEGRCFGSNRVESALCPECIRCDVTDLGFAYWRRSHQNGMKVCAKHNVKLIFDCPFCGSPFAHNGHDFDVLWKSCEGRHLKETFSLCNYDDEELKRAKLYREMLFHEFHIPEETALRALLCKVKSIEASGGWNLRHFRDFDFGKLALELESALQQAIDRYWLNDSSYYSYEDLIFNSLLVGYVDFDEFLESIKYARIKERAINSLWQTYRSNSRYAETAEYVDDDQLLGGGHWSRPYPSQLSKLLGSKDWFHSMNTRWYKPQFRGAFP
ncbi:TniQ family protein [Pseudomonas fluorescens]|uniref:TniQ family protein n=1 Tax=Pseudomonas fluorescens TaxID=294 RepID=UPI001255CE53|nr:hypothetical protein PS861_03652 [Pseudomonas fluorescens]